MTPEQKLLAFAKALRWKDLRKISGRTPEEDRWVGKRFIAHYNEWSREIPLPDWPGSRDAMGAAEEVLTDEQWPVYLSLLTAKDQKTLTQTWRPAVSATASQRFDAMGRTLNLWKE